MPILIEYPRPYVALLTIDNLAKHNAMSRAMMAELAARWDELENSACRCIVLTGAGAKAFNAGADVSGECGYSNLDGTGMLQNFFSANGAQTTPFGGPNLDGPPNLNGPQAGMVADPVLVPLGGVGAIQNEVIATLTIDQNLGDLNFLFENSVRVEFGSGAAFITIPEPGTLAGLAIGLSVLTRRARR